MVHGAQQRGWLPAGTPGENEGIHRVVQSPAGRRPAGASWHHGGPGNVDRMNWVTMTDAGPQIGSIALKGIFDRKGLDSELFGAYDREGAE